MDDNGLIAGLVESQVLAGKRAANIVRRLHESGVVIPQNIVEILSNLSNSVGIWIDATSKKCQEVKEENNQN